MAEALGDVGMSQFHEHIVKVNGGATAELMEALEETQMALGSMMASRYITPFKEEVQEWIVKLSTVSEQLEIWMQVQAMWMYLEAVFTSGDIAKQMPLEAKRFQNIDKNWEKMMAKAFETRNVVQYCFGNDVLKNLLPHLLEQLEVCQKALSGYLDQKRAAFPRFFFVSDAVLLDPSLSAAELYAKLTAVKGIGPWSAHMYQMFGLLQPDIFPTGDLGVRNGIKEAFGLRGAGKNGALDEKRDKEKLEAAMAPFAPYRSLAAWYMWRCADTPSFLE